VVAVFKPFEQERLRHLMEDPEFREVTARRAQIAVRRRIVRGSGKLLRFAFVAIRGFLGGFNAAVVRNEYDRGLRTTTAGATTRLLPGSHVLDREGGP
jgi:RNase P protein component